MESSPKIQKTYSWPNLLQKPKQINDDGNQFAWRQKVSRSHNDTSLTAGLF